MILYANQFLVRRIMGSHDFCGVCQISGFEGKTCRVRSETPRATKARDEATQRVASSWRIQCPIEATQCHTLF
jgi:hypothetical protein